THRATVDSTERIEIRCANCGGLVRVSVASLGMHRQCPSCLSYQLITGSAKDANNARAEEAALATRRPKDTACTPHSARDVARLDAEKTEWNQEALVCQWLDSVLAPRSRAWRAGRWCRRHPKTILAVLIGLIVGIGYYWFVASAPADPLQEYGSTLAEA